MKYILLLFFSFSYLLFAFDGKAQKSKGSLSEEEILKIYEEQLREGYSSRGMTDFEIEKYISKGKEGISTVNDFAKQLPLLFSDKTNEGLAVVFFFFKNDATAGSTQCKRWTQHQWKTYFLCKFFSF